MLGTSLSTPRTVRIETLRAVQPPAGICVCPVQTELGSHSRPSRFSTLRSSPHPSVSCRCGPGLRSAPRTGALRDRVGAIRRRTHRPGTATNQCLLRSRAGEVGRVAAYQLGIATSRWTPPTSSRGQRGTIPIVLEPPIPVHFSANPSPLPRVELSPLLMPQLRSRHGAQDARSTLLRVLVRGLGTGVSPQAVRYWCRVHAAPEVLRLVNSNSV